MSEKLSEKDLQELCDAIADLHDAGHKEMIEKLSEKELQELCDAIADLHDAGHKDWPQIVPKLSDRHRDLLAKYSGP